MKKIIWMLAFSLNISVFAGWVETPNASNGGHPDFINSNKEQIVKSITIQNNCRSENFDIYISVQENLRNDLRSLLVKENFNADIPGDDEDDSSWHNTWPDHIFVHEAIGDLKKVEALLERLLRVNTGISDPILGRMKEFAGEVQAEYYNR